ncbi:hypothetical protein GF319_15560 [Candidatus Bathyarchaeota archaeon]|nr:hypothetical protein [Candidatus Bathyarchaeota archaeon]
MRILLDTNILVHAFNRSSPYQVEAADTLRRGLTKEFEAFIAPQMIFEFYAVITDPRRVEKPLSLEEAAGPPWIYWRAKSSRNLVHLSWELERS